MADFVGPCDECGRIYNHSKLKMCPSCAVQADAQRVSERSTNEPQFSSVSNAQSFGSNDKLEKLLLANIYASNRTTSAVRAIVSLFAILTITSVVSFILYFLGLWIATGLRSEFLLNATFVVVGLVTLGGVVTAYWQFFVEWTNSKIPTRI